ncbi:hypothetical protein ARMSODRAFT_983300 [Armillaria solidipes]|uniref:Uncharacterized protein n=1 Tax=Armillaria solidipes TaxID=1076256 RepID=A0A2H3AJT0_9AGAR|nr:hypothetical protein ARMSODRAFT_983300 [Armillaria solidipes]
MLHLLDACLLLFLWAQVPLLLLPCFFLDGGPAVPAAALFLEIVCCNIARSLGPRKVSLLREMYATVRSKRYEPLRPRRPFLIGTWRRYTHHTTHHEYLVCNPYLPHTSFYFQCILGMGMVLIRKELHITEALNAQAKICLLGEVDQILCNDSLQIGWHRQQSSGNAESIIGLVLGQVSMAVYSGVPRFVVGKYA